jgi:predicted nucleic acid-binding protein
MAVLTVRNKPDDVHRALRVRAEQTLYLSSVTLAELLFGIRALPAGKRKNLLDRALTELLALFKDRVLPFDTDAARHYADLTVTATNGGRGFTTPEGDIAAVAASRVSAGLHRGIARHIDLCSGWREGHQPMESAVLAVS